MHAHRKSLLALLLTIPMLMAADCGHGGGSPCPQRAEGYADGPDAGVGVAEEEAFVDDDTAEAVGTGGGGGGGGPEECRRQ